VVPESNTLDCGRLSRTRDGNGSDLLYEIGSDITFYQILIRFLIWIQIFSNMNTKQMFQIQTSIWIFTQLNSKYILLNSMYMNKILLLSSSITKFK